MPSHRAALLLAAASALSAVSASNLPRNDVADVPQTRTPDIGGFGDTRHGALEYVLNEMGAPAPPEPTPAPRHPRFGAMPLMDREAVLANTCGYFSATGSSGPYFDWFVCANSQAVCTTSGTIRQCCHTTECSTTTFGTTCLDYSACDSTRNPNTYCCTYTNAQPYCTSFLWSTNGGAAFTFFGCGEEDTSRVQIMYASTEGIDIGIPTTATGSEIVESTPTSDASSRTSQESNASGTSTAGAGGDSDSDSGNNNSSSSAPVGAIVGGVVGGLAVISLIALGVFFIIRKSRSNATANNPAAQPFMAPPPPPGPMQQHQSPPPFGNVGSVGYAPSAGTAPTPYSMYSNPHQSVYSNVGLPPVSPGGHSPHGAQAWAPPSASPPPPGWQQGQAPAPQQWEASKDPGAGYQHQPQQNVQVQELGDTNPVGQWGGNNRAELG